MALKVSVLISSYNHENYIRECIESIWEQNYPNIEILIIDDNSKDRTYEILKELKKQSPYPMEVFRNKKNKGISKNLNFLAKKAKGSFISFMSSDDRYFGKDAIGSNLEILLKNTNCKAVYSECLTWDGKNYFEKYQGKYEKEAIKEKKYKELLDYMLTNVPTLLIQSMVIRKEFFEEIGGFDEDVRADDWILNIKILQNIIKNKYKICFNNNVTFLYRQHESNSIRKRDYLLALIEEVINKYTPYEKRNYFLGKIYWGHGLFLIKNIKTIKGIKYLLKSQIINPSLDNFIHTIKKFKTTQK